jgi:hypothetical protein
MKRTRLLFNTSSLLMVHFLIICGFGMALLPTDCFWAAENSAVAPINPTMQSGSSPNVPIVFVSRDRMSTLQGTYIGPPVDISRRELTPGGRLMLWQPDGIITELTRDAGLYDVQQPDISFTGDTVVFSAVTAPLGQWRLWEMGLDGKNLRQLTFDDRNIPIPPDPHYPRANDSIFGRYGDFGPVYLPDGRIMFVSTRYLTLSGSCGQRGQNLYVLEPATGIIARRTTERSGAIDPFVLHDGRIVFSHWIDAMNVPSDMGSGLRSLETEYNFAPSSWGIWAMKPDGSDAARYAFILGGLVDQGGVHQPHELLNGDLVVSYRQIQNLLGDTLPSAITIFSPGAVPVHELQFLGNPFSVEGPHALGPAPLPDGRIVCSYTPYATVQRDQDGIRSANYDFGLYVTDPSLKSISLLYNDPQKDELDAVAVVARTAPIVPDEPDVDSITDDPTVHMNTTAALINSNVYSDLPLHVTELPSPRVGTVAWIDIYDDSQQFETSDDYPLLRKQMPRLVQRSSVSADGSFSATVPADRPLLFTLVDKDGVAVQSPMSPKLSNQPGESLVHSFNGHDYLRPNATVHCAGCHRGHMMQPDLVKAARPNLARLAVASASSQRNTFLQGAHRVNDLRLSNPTGAYSWMTLKGRGSWVQLNWSMPVTVDKITLYPVVHPNVFIKEAVITLSDNSQFQVGQLPKDGTPVDITLDGLHTITWAKFTVARTRTILVGLAEMVVNGPAGEVKIADVPPPAPVNLKATQGTVYLTWDRNTRGTEEPEVAGYRILFGTSPGVYDHSIDVGNTNSHLMRDLLEDSKTYYFVVKSYNIYGTQSTSFTNQVHAAVRGPKVASIEPDHGPVAGGTMVTVKGENFHKGGVRLRIGDFQAMNVRVIDAKTLIAVTHSQSPGIADVKVSNPDDLSGSLPGGFNYDLPQGVK